MSFVSISKVYDAHCIAVGVIKPYIIYLPKFDGNFKKNNARVLWQN